MVFLLLQRFTIKVFIPSVVILLFHINPKLEFINNQATRILFKLGTFIYLNQVSRIFLARFVHVLKKGTRKMCRGNVLKKGTKKICCGDSVNPWRILSPKYFEKSSRINMNSVIISSYPKQIKSKCRLYGRKLLEGEITDTVLSWFYMTK